MPRDKESGSAGYGPRWDRRRKKLRKRWRWDHCWVCGNRERVEIHHVWYAPWLLLLVSKWHKAPRPVKSANRWLRDKWPKWLLPDRYFMGLCRTHHAEITGCHAAKGPEFTVHACTRRLIGPWKWWTWRVLGWLGTWLYWVVGIGIVGWTLYQ